MQDVSEVDAATLQHQPTFASLAVDTWKHPRYASVDARRRSFLTDTAQIPRGQDVNVLADAGFFHVGKSKLGQPLRVRAALFTYFAN